MSDRRSHVIALCAGGTGGHLFPAEALGAELIARGHRVYLLTDERGGRFARALPPENLHVVPSDTFRGRDPLALSRTGIRITAGFLASRRRLQQIGAEAVIGFGGYPTVPPMLAAASLRLPVAIQEQNAVAGRANRLVARFASVIATAAPEVGKIDAKDRPKCRFLGTPVRPAVLEASAPYEPPAAGGPLNLLVFGGSQGARVFSDLLPKALAVLPGGLRDRLRVVQQVREEDMARVAEAYRALGLQAELAPFFTDLPRRMSAAHLVVSRAGASTVAELAVLGRPAILVPLPHALDQDQKANAEVLQEVGGGWLIEEKELTPERLGAELVRLADSPGTLAEAAAKAQTVARPRAVEHLADLAEALAAGEFAARR